MRPASSVVWFKQMRRDSRSKSCQIGKTTSSGWSAVMRALRIGLRSGMVTFSMYSHADLCGAIDIMKNNGEFSVYQHDNLFRERRPDAYLTSTFGDGLWSATPPAPCKDIIGERTIQCKYPRTSERRGESYARRISISKHKIRCRCSFPPTAFPTCSPDLNMTENAFQWLTVWMRRKASSDGWPRDTRALEERLQRAVDELNEDRDWFASAFDSLKRRCNRVVRLHGDKTEY